MKVSIVIPTYNRAELLIEALRSIHSQKHRPVEVIVVDDGSTDDTEAQVDRFQQDTSHEAEFKLRFVKQKQLGAGVARNHGATIANGDYVLFLDSDDVLTPDGVAGLVCQAVENGLPDLVIGRVELTDEKLKPMDQTVGVAPENLRSDLLEYQWHTMGALYRTPLIQKAGGWDERIRGSDDWVFQVRIKLAAQSHVFCNTKVGLWRQHSGERLGATTFSKNYTRDVTMACASINRSAVDADALDTTMRRNLTLRCLRHAWELGRYKAWPERQDAFRRTLVICGDDIFFKSIIFALSHMPSPVDNICHRMLEQRNKVAFNK
jgi:glycosyltransferase involved in cell wall biosynthesis